MRAILLAAVLLAGCAPTETLYWVKSDGTRMDKTRALQSQLNQDETICQHRKTDIAASGVGSTTPATGAKDNAVANASDDEDIAEAFSKGDAIDKTIQAKMIFNACMKDRGYRQSPGHAPVRVATKVH